MLNNYKVLNSCSTMANEFTHFQQIQNLCLLELDQLQKNLDNTVEATKVLLNSFTENKYNFNEYCEESLTVYDKCVTTLTDIMNASRKANVTYKLKLSEVRELIRYFYKRDMLCRDKIEINTKLKAIELPSSQMLKPNTNTETEVIDITSDKIDIFNLFKDKSVYKEGSTIFGHISHIENPEDLIFYIVDANSESVRLLKELSIERNLIKYNKMPSNNVIFGLELDDVIVRAVFTKFVSLNAENFSKSRKALLLDYGDKIDVSETTVFYELDEKYKKLPSQALLSRLCSEENNVHLQKKLESLLRETVKFRVKCVENDILYLYLCDYTTNGIITDSKNMQLKNAEATANGWITDAKNNDQYDGMSSYFEEPTTTNALKAIMGYIPKDDIRLCQFYDPKTGGCFKGKNCNKVHEPKPMNGLTKDMQVSSNVLNNNENIHSINNFICVQPTHIISLDQMYCNVVNYMKPTDPHIWTDKDNLRPLKKLPHLHDIVLARYNDGFWYRGKVVDENINQNTVVVLYVDYGNTDIVALKDLAHCEISIARMPHRAILCKVANVSDITETEEQRAEGLHMLRSRLLNDKLDVEIEVHYEDLIINFLDKDVKELFENLKQIKYLSDYV